jgi:hypothetical protein
MSHQLKKEYLEAIRERYKKAARFEKTLILNEFCCVCGYARKYAIAILNNRVEPLKARQRGRKAKYDSTVVLHLVRLWKALGAPGSTKFKAALPEWIEFDEDPAVKNAPELKQKLIELSRPQMDRLLAPYRSKTLGGLGSTRRARRNILNQIPMQAKDWNVTEPGQQVQADTVAHCGTSLLGQFANSLTLTDLHSAWTENRAIWCKGSARVIEAMRSIESNLPFKIKGFKTDSGSEFINYEMIVYFKENRASNPVTVTRSRPYKKNDNCYVEQKNFTHVRELFGYERFDDRELVDLMNEIYSTLWGPLQNFFMPTQKLLRKYRIGAKIKKEYEKAVTPYHRLLNSPSLSEEQKSALRNKKNELNPFHLQKQLQLKLKEFEERIRKRNTGLLAA